MQDKRRRPLEKTVWVQKIGDQANHIVIVGIIAAPGVWAQSLSSTASLSGTISDPSGARVPKATITINNPEKGITRVATAGSAGEFSFALLPAGTYTLQASASGFKTSKQTGIVLNVGDSLTENVALSIGASEQVEVSESGPLLQTEDANVSTAIAAKQVEELPLNLRNVVGLVMLNSSVNNQTQQQILASGGAEDTADQDMSFLSFGGGFFGTTAFLLDGGWPVAGGWGGVVYVPFGWTIMRRSSKVTTNSFSAVNYGWSTGNVAVNMMITKSGTSNFHFVVDEFLRNQALDANTYFHNLAGEKRRPTIAISLERQAAARCISRASTGNTTRHSFLPIMRACGSTTPARTAQMCPQPPRNRATSLQLSLPPFSIKMRWADRSMRAPSPTPTPPGR